MTIERDDEAIGRLHGQASRVLDERPDARVRLEVLAAAARAVEARPQDAAHPRAPCATRRWPLSAAALLVVSLMTGLVATHAMRDDPDRIVAAAATTTSPTSVSPASQNDATAVGVKPDSPSPVPPASRAPVPARPSVARPATTTQRPRLAETTRAALADADRTAAASLDGAERLRKAEPASSLSTAASLAPLPVPARPAEDSARGRTAPPMRIAGVVGESQRGRVDRPTTPEAWVERIVRMRADDNDVEADRELEALRRRYPDFVIPRAAFRLVRPP